LVIGHFFIGHLSLVILSLVIPMVQLSLILVNLCAVILMVLALPGGPLPVPLAAVRLLLGLAVALFCPGYAAQMALFPRRNTLDGAERLALSVGISLALVPLLALMLDALPWGIGLGPVVGAEAGATLLASALAWARWRRLPPGDRWEWEIPWADLAGRSEPSSRFWLGSGLALVLILGLILLLTVAQLARWGEPVTEFYLLGPERQAGGYPYRGRVGEPVTVTVGIVNRERVPVEYRLEVADGERLLGQAGPVRLSPGAAYEGPVSFIPARPGDRVRVTFLLYRSGLPIPYRMLWLWLEVEE
jgi:uncharacterized membrane protein